MGSICPTCGGAIDRWARSCSRCGSQLIRCNNCEAINDRFFKFCHSCGKPIMVPPITRANQTAIDRKIPSKILSEEQIGQMVYNYLLSRGGTMSWEIASRELNIPINDLQKATNRLMNEGKISSQKKEMDSFTTSSRTYQESQKVEELVTLLDPLTLTVIAQMLETIKGAKNHPDYNKIDELTTRISKVALDVKKPLDAAQLDFRDQLKLITLVFEFVRDKVFYKGEPFGGLIRKPWETLETGGDCDCKAILLATMLDNLGFRKLIISVLPPGKYLDTRKKQTINLEGHVLIETGLVENNESIWIRMDPSCSDCDIDEIPEIFLAFLPNFYRVPIHFK